MTVPPTPAAVLLVELSRRGITLRSAGDRLRYHPRSPMTSDLADRMAVNKADLMAILAAADDVDSATTTPDDVAYTPGDVSHTPGAAACTDADVAYTAAERELLAGLPPTTWAAALAVKSAFAGVDELTVVEVVPSRSRARDAAARIIRETHHQDGCRARDLRDAWEERVAIVTMHGDEPLVVAERVALEEPEFLLAGKQG